MARIEQHSLAPAHTGRLSLPWVDMAKAALVLSLLAVATGPAFVKLMNVWLRQPEYSHGFLVPAVSVAIAWLGRERLRGLPMRSSYVLGPAVMLAGALLLVLGRVGGLLLFETLSPVVLIPGVVLTLWGRDWGRALALPFAYLIFMVPIAEPFIGDLHWSFRLFAARSSALLISLAGIPLHRDGTLLEMPHISLQVADECSGLSFMVSILAIAVALGHFTQRTRRGKIILLGLAFIIALATNTLRIVLIAFWTTLDTSIVHGPFHILQGLFVSVAGFVLLLVSSWFLRRLLPGSPEKPPSSSPHPAPHGHTGAGRGWVVASGILMGLVLYLALFRPVPVVLARDLDSFPRRMGPWVAHPSTPRIHAPGADEELSLTYQHPDRERLRLYVAYYAHQEQGKEIVFFGDEKLRGDARLVPVPQGGSHPIDVGAAVTGFQGDPSVVYSWYVVDGRAMASRTRAKLATAFRGVLQGQTDGMLVVLAASPGTVRDAERLFSDGVPAVHADLIRRLVPESEAFLAGSPRP